MEKSVIKYLNVISKFKLHKIIITDKAFTIVQDDIETIANWTEFKSVIINNDFINILGNENYLIPKKAMSTSEFELLRTVVSDKLKNG